MPKWTPPPTRETAFSSTITKHGAPYAAIDPTRPQLSAKGKVVLITGGGQGIGLSIALGFAKANASHVILLGRTVSTLDSGKSKILESYPFINVHVFVADVTDASAISSIFTKIHSEIGPINICISNASYPPQLCPMSSGSIEDWFKSFEVMVKGGLIVAQEFLKHKSESNAAFINISSSATEARFVPGFSAYSSAKLAMAKAMLYLQAENADVRVVSVHPGVIRSDMTLDGEKDFGFEFDYDDYDMPGHFCVWITSPEAEFLGGRYVWAAWDVGDLVERKEEILKNDFLTFGLVH